MVVGCHFLATHSTFILLLSHKRKVFVFPTGKVVYILTQVPNFTCSCYHSFLQISLLSSFPLLPLSAEEPYVCFHLCESPCIEESSLGSSVVATMFSFSLKPSKTSSCLLFLFESTTSSSPNYILTPCLWFQLSWLIQKCTLPKFYPVTSFYPDLCLLLIYIFLVVPLWCGTYLIQPSSWIFPLIVNSEFIQCFPLQFLYLC